MGLYNPAASSGGGLYSRTGSGGYVGSGKPKSHGGGGVLDALGPVGEVLGDAKDTIVGAPLGAYELVRHPIGTVEKLGPAMLAPYAKLVRGDFSGLTSGDDWLNFILDAATIATLGGAGAVRAGAILGKAGVISDASRLAKLGEAGTITLRGPSALAGENGGLEFARATSTNPVIRGRQNAVHNLLNRLPNEARLVGEQARFWREMRRNPAARAQVLQQAAGPYLDAFGKLSKDERSAFGVLARVPLAEHLDTWKKLLDEEARVGNEEARGLLERLSDPKVMKLYLEPTDAMLKAHAEASRVGELSADQLVRLGVLTKDAAEAARYRHTRIAGGADVYTAADARAAVRNLDKEIRANQRVQTEIEKRIAQLRGRGTPELRAVRKMADQTARIGQSAAERRQRYEAAVAGEMRAATQRANRRAEQASARRGKQGATLAARERRLEHARDQLLNELTSPKGADPSAVAERIRKVDEAERAVQAARDQGRAGRRDAAEIAKEQANPAAAAARNGRPVKAGPPNTQLEDAVVGLRQQVELAMLQHAREDLAHRIAAGRAELPRLHELEQHLKARRDEIHPGIVGGPTVGDLRQQIDQAGRPQPIYLPDVPEHLAPRVGGAGAFTYGTPVHHSEGLLFVTGRLALNPDVLSPQFMRTVVFAHYRDLHDLLLDAAVQVPAGGKLADGWVYVRRPAGLGEVPAAGKLREPGEFPGIPKGLTVDKPEEALIEHGARYAVPVKLARQVDAEFQRSTNAAAKIFDRSTSVWRALVLNLRVAWLTNNIVGNHLMYALRYAGPAGLHGYLDAVATSKGAAAARRLLNMPETRKALTPADIAELVPEQAAGTFIGSQAPRTRTSRVANKAGLGLATANNATEGALRRAAVHAELRRNPAVKARMRSMPAETRTFREAARAELAANPQLARDVSRKVNDALGDFLAMSAGERRYLRTVFPFYSWYKAITKVVLKLPLDAPGRANLLSKLGQIGAVDSAGALGALPSYLEGSIPLGGDELLKTQALNPYATLVQLARAGAVPFTPGAKTNELAGVMNPFVQLAGAGIFGKDATKRGLLADFTTGLVTDLPQVKLAQTLINGPAPSKLYKPSAIDELLAFLGAGHKTYVPGRAAELSAQGA